MSFLLPFLLITNCAVFSRKTPGFITQNVRSCVKAQQFVLLMCGHSIFMRCPLFCIYDLIQVTSIYFQRGPCPDQKKALSKNISDSYHGQAGQNAKAN